ncbi:hypothetical protein M2114_000413 [Aurantimicrobium minutum]|uniref:hypothetical protein n=1 Tax=Aurantimicrobium minutum TaxID=708131 RepID=UPI00247300ED|nr:hypothetical protein [Aurantimicrobium minutum]MDH6207092.1 hypothetical protein [Aurantimicrobium minutum]MDH6424296.1 hypothetical protein [Aurantimicrobium minutum]
MAKSTPTNFDPAEEPKAAAAKTAAPKNSAAPAGEHTTYPGQTLGIVALVLAFFLPVPALALGIIAWVWSNKASKNNVLAKIAIGVSAAFTVIGFFLFGLWIALAGAVFGGFDRGHDDIRFGGGTVQIMPGQGGMGQLQMPGGMDDTMRNQDGDQGGRMMPVPSDLPSATATTN